MPKEEVWISIQRNWHSLNVDNLIFEELGENPADMGEISLNPVWVRVLQGSNETGGFGVPRFVDRLWKIFRGTVRCS